MKNRNFDKRRYEDTKKEMHVADVITLKKKGNHTK